MAILLVIRCPECTEKFRLPKGDKWPDFCPHCGTFVGTDPSFVPDRLNIGTSKGKAADATFRQIEAASIERAEAAGDPNLKITDMNDNLRAGDVAAKSGQPSQAYQEQCAAIEAKAEFLPNVQGLAGLAKQGPGGDGSYALAAIQGGSPPTVPRAPSIPGAGFGGGFAPPG